MVLFYVYDEFTDVEDEKGASRIADSVMDAIRNPDKPRPAGEFRVAELARQYVHISPYTSPSGLLLPSFQVSP